MRRLGVGTEAAGESQNVRLIVKVSDIEVLLGVLDPVGLRDPEIVARTPEKLGQKIVGACKSGRVGKSAASKMSAPAENELNPV